MSEGLRIVSGGLRIAVAALGAALTLASSAGAAQAEVVSQTFTTAGEQQFVVPPGVTSVQATLVGGHGGGGDGEAPGGTGATVSATLAVRPGQILYAEVGGDGQPGELPGDDHGGYNGGGAGAIKTFLFASGPAGGGGGGASDVRTCATTTAPAECGGRPSSASRLLVAAGGGGGGGNGLDPTTTAGGVGGVGDQPGTAGAHDLIGDLGGSGGTRGSATVGGNGGTPSGSCSGSGSGCAGDGALGLGGAGGESLSGGGGGGGGGIYGGGGGGGGAFGEISPTEFANGGGGGGGGGASGIPAGASGVSGFSYTPSAEGAQPAVTFAWTPAPPAVITGAASAVNATTATLNGSVNPDAWQIVSCDFDISPAPAGVSSFPCAQQLTAGGAPIAVSATAAGLSPHTTYTVTLAAASNQGAGSGAPITFTTAAASPGAGPAGAGSPRALTIADLRLAPARFRRGRRPASIAKRTSRAPASATTISFVLSEAANVRLGFEARQRGVLAGGKCTAASKLRHKGKRCTRYVAISGRVVLHAAAGADKIVFDGALSGGKELSPGTYRLSLTAEAGSVLAQAAQRPIFGIIK